MAAGTITVCLWIQEEGSVQKNIEVTVVVSVVFGPVFHEHTCRSCVTSL